jgi:hypothetical protein
MSSSYRGFVAVPPPPPSPPTSSFNIIPQRPSKPQPCIILPHPRFPGVYVAGDHDDDDESSLLYTRNLVPGIQSLDQDVIFSVQDENEGTVEYREWDPFKSRLASAILSGAQNIWIVSSQFSCCCQYCFSFLGSRCYSFLWFMFCRNPVHVYS